VCGSPVSSHHSPHTHTPLRMKTLDGRHAVPTGQVLNCIATDIGLWPLAFVDIHLRFCSNPSGIYDQTFHRKVKYTTTRTNV